MGAVNMMALEEFNECDQRFTFLTRERDDLLQSIADTQQAIAELDAGVAREDSNRRSMPSTKTFRKRSTRFSAAEWRRCG